VQSARDQPHGQHRIALDAANGDAWRRTLSAIRKRAMMRPFAITIGAERAA
jgi:hypothetical protein